MDTIGKRFKKKTKGAPFLPDEIITNILIRLSAKSAMRCRLVCRRLRDLTMTREFEELNLKNNAPTILVASFSELSPLNLFTVDKWWEHTERSIISNIHGFRLYSGKGTVLFSHCGLIVLREDMSLPLPSKFTIFNPTRPRHECVTIFSEYFSESKICGVYYHPSLKEYCSLWKINRIYKMLNLGFNPSFETISNPFSNRVEKKYAYPLFINNCIYWLLESTQGSKYTGCNDIMEFDIVKEEFMVIPCPVPLNTKCLRKQTHLLIIDGILSFMLILPSEIIIWRLEDHAQKLWVATEYALSREICNSYKTVGGIDGIAGVDGKLALTKNNIFHVCNPVEGTVKNYPDIKYRVSNDTGWMRRSDVLYLTHHMSLASLKNCKSEILIGKNCKVWARDRA